MSLNNLSIRLQVLIPLLLASLLMLLMAVISKQEIDGAIQDMNETTASVTRHKDDIAALIHATYRLRTNAIYGLYDEALFAQLPAQLSAAEQEIGAILTRLVVTGAEQDNRQVAAALQAYLGHTRSSMLPLLTAKYQGSGDPAAYEQARLHFRDLGEALIKQIDAMSVHINQLTQTEIAEEQAHDRATLLRTLLLMGGTLIAALLGGWWISGRIVQPIGQLQEVMHAVALGRFNVRANAEGNNELGQLARDINRTLSQLANTIQTLTSISGNVASAATELAAVMTQAEVNAQQQRGETEQVASAVTELASTADNVNHNAALADELARDANSRVEQGLALFAESIEANGRMAGSLENAATVVARLKSQSEQIGKVIEVIQSISEQTNLLALNAAIEAARAGEQGRGFAVVADEVRALASKTQESTAAIQQIIAKLQTVAGQAVHIARQGSDEARVGVQRVVETEVALGGITVAVERIHQMAEQMAAAAEQQNVVAEDIARQISNISQAAEQNADVTARSAQLGGELETTAHSLHALVARFNT